MERTAVVLLAALMFSCTAAAANATEGDLIEEATIQIPIDEEEEISPRIENQLSVNDTVRLKITGRALDSGLVAWNVTETSYLECNDVQTACNLSIDAMSSQEIYISMQGTMVGQGGFVIEGTSEWTELAGRDSVQVSVIPRTAEGVREASGIDVLQLLVIVGLGGLVYAVSRRP